MFFRCCVFELFIGVSVHATMEKGTIVRLMDKGYGFIKREGESKDLFFHSNELEEGVDFNSLQEGADVSFEVVQGMKGPQATNIQVL